MIALGSMAASVAAVQTTLARVVQIKTVNGVSYFYSDLDVDRVFDGQDYLAANSCTVSQLQTMIGTSSSQSVSIDVLLQDDAINSPLLDSGMIDNAEVSISVIDWNTSPVSGFLLFKGFVASLTYKDELTATLTVQPLADKGVALALDSFSMNCRADLGDSQCKFPITNLKKTGAVVSYTDMQNFVTDNTDTDGKWCTGLIVFSSGPNANFAFEIQMSSSTGLITLKLMTPFPVAAGDAFTLYPGCDKTPGTCQGVYNNIVNFRGEPFTIAPWIATADNAASTTATSGAAPAPIVSVTPVTNPYFPPPGFSGG